MKGNVEREFATFEGKTSQLGYFFINIKTHGIILKLIFWTNSGND
jgi:hypothetical protein